MLKSDPSLSSAPTIEEVARLCGVSKGTVSKALNGQERLVAEATRERILRTAESIGFVPNWRARVWVTRRTQMLAVVHSSLNHAVPHTLYWDFLDRLDELLSARGYSMMFIPGQESHPAMRLALSDGRFDGVLCMGLVGSAVVRRIEETALPSVMVNVGLKTTRPQIVVDDVGGTEQAMRHLLSLGHERIAFRSDCSVEEHSARRDRLDTYVRCMEQAGHDPFEFQLGAADDFIAWLLGLPPHRRPTAVLDSEFRTAVPLLRAAWLAGLKVPQDLSVATFNDAYPAAETIPALTTVAFPSAQMAELAMKMIFEQIDGSQPDFQAITLPTHLVVRESTGTVPTPAGRLGSGSLIARGSDFAKREPGINLE